MSVPVRPLMLVAALASVALPGPALAHLAPVDDLPRTFLEGLLSGFEQPMVELDHLAAVFGIGLLSGLAARGIVPLLAFSVAAIAGVALSLSSADLPAGDLLVGLTTIGIGVLVATRQSMRPALAAALFAVAGLLHGDSLGTSIEGARSMPLLAYILGVLTVQVAVGTIACIAALQLAGWPWRRAGLMVAGILVVLAGGIAAANGALM